MADYQAISNVMKQILALSPEEQRQVREQLKLHRENAICNSCGVFNSSARRGC